MDSQIVKPGIMVGTAVKKRMDVQHIFPVLLYIVKSDEQQNGIEPSKI